MSKARSAHEPKGQPTRPLYVIAAEIRRYWTRPHYSTRPYLDAMSELESINDRYGVDDARDVVVRFLSNAKTWRGEHARRVKAELRSML